MGAVREAVVHIERTAQRHAATTVMASPRNIGGNFKSTTYRIGGVTALVLNHDPHDAWAVATPWLHTSSNIPLPVLKKIRAFLAEAIPELKFVVDTRRHGLTYGFSGRPFYDGGTCVHAEYGGKTWTTRPKIEEPFFAKMIRRVAKITKRLTIRSSEERI